MENNQKIIIGNKRITRKVLFEEKEAFRKVQAGLPFVEKIRILVALQRIANSWGKIDVMIWRL